MARKRIISPEMFTSDTIASLPIPTRWTWCGLICYLDDEGRGKDNPALIKAAVWPQDETYTNRKIRADLDRLVGIGSVCRYECCGVRQIHAPAWESWQKISHPTPTRLCPCPSHDRGAHVIHRRDSGAAPERFSAIEVSSNESNLSEAAGRPQPCKHGRLACLACQREDRKAATA